VIEGIFKRKIELLENHARMVRTELKRKQGDEFLCKQQEFEIIKPQLSVNTSDKAVIRKAELNAAKAKQ
jgi:hypothetical protein